MSRNYAVLVGLVGGALLAAGGLTIYHTQQLVSITVEAAQALFQGLGLFSLCLGTLLLAITWLTAVVEDARAPNLFRRLDDIEEGLEKLTQAEAAETVAASGSRTTIMRALTHLLADARKSEDSADGLPDRDDDLRGAAKDRFWDAFPDELEDYQEALTVVLRRLPIDKIHEAAAALEAKYKAADAQVPDLQLEDAALD